MHLQTTGQYLQSLQLFQDLQTSDPKMTESYNHKLPKIDQMLVRFGPLALRDCLQTMAQDCTQLACPYIAFAAHLDHELLESALRTALPTFAQIRKPGLTSCDALAALPEPAALGCRYHGPEIVVEVRTPPKSPKDKDTQYDLRIARALYYG